MFASRDNGKLGAELASARARISELEAELSRTSSHDAISHDLLTLRGFRTQLELDVRRAERYGRPLAVALIDIDRFREFNLKQGYGAGDLVLAGVGSAIAQVTRTNDLACRIGGDEFAVLFPETDHTGAEDAVGRILVSLEDLDAGGVRGHSASAGIAMLEPTQTPEALLAAAGKALQRRAPPEAGRPWCSRPRPRRRWKPMPSPVPTAT